MKLANSWVGKFAKFCKSFISKATMEFINAKCMANVFFLSGSKLVLSIFALKTCIDSPIFYRS